MNAASTNSAFASQRRYFLLAALGVDAVGLDGDDDSDLVAAAVPGIGAAEVALRERLDVVGAALAGHRDDRATHGVVPAGLGWVRHGDCDPRVAAQVSCFLEFFGGVEDDVLAVGVDPGLAQLW